MIFLSNTMVLLRACAIFTLSTNPLDGPTVGLKSEVKLFLYNLVFCRLCSPKVEKNGNDRVPSLFLRAILCWSSTVLCLRKILLQSQPLDTLVPSVRERRIRGLCKARRVSFLHIFVHICTVAADVLCFTLFCLPVIIQINCPCPHHPPRAVLDTGMVSMSSQRRVSQSFGAPRLWSRGIHGHLYPIACLGS